MFRNKTGNSLGVMAQTGRPRTRMWFAAAAAMLGMFTAIASLAASSAPSEAVLFSFGAGSQDGANPFAALLAATDGNYYGTTRVGGAYDAGTIYQLAPSGVFTTLYSFGSSGGAAAYPHAELIEGNDGNFYGTTLGGGANGQGTVYRITPAGTFSILYSFGTATGDGSSPQAALVQATDGNFYGTTSSGGTCGFGTIFKLTPGGTLTTFYTFGLPAGATGCSAAPAPDGASSVATLVQGSDGNLYGTTSAGGSKGNGTVFEINFAQSLTSLYSFGTQTTDGANPQAALLYDNVSGLFYGTTENGGAGGTGTVFSIGLGTTATSITTVYSFSASPSPDGAFPRAALAQDASGNLYGTTEAGGANNLGSVFELTTGGALTTLYSFGSPATNGINPVAALIVQSNNGSLVFYGTTLNGGSNNTGIVFNLSATGTLTVLHQFGASAPSNGANPEGDLVQDSQGNLYGTTQAGGANGEGSVFEITTSGTLTTLYSFGASSTDGANPVAGLVLGTGTNPILLYGTTVSGGANGRGTVFQLSVPTTGTPTETLLYSFGSVGNDGNNPESTLILGSDGNYYGTTFAGGAHSGGTVFRIPPGGSSLTTIYSFGATSGDGTQPAAGLIVGSDGNFYGTTYAGGSAGNGTVFNISLGGAETVLYNFGSGTQDGANPDAALVLGSDGNYYGTTHAGGANGKGSVFQLMVSGGAGTLATIYSFGTSGGDGSNPDSKLVQAKDGNFYGTTNGGGADGDGTLFRVTSSGKESVLYSFGSQSGDGENPFAGLLIGADGNFYGSTNSGGANGTGTIFKAMNLAVATSSGSSAPAGGGGAVLCPTLWCLAAWRLARGRRRR